MTSSNGNIFRVTVQLCGEFTGDRDKGQWHGALMFSLICASVNNLEAGDWRRHLRPLWRESNVKNCFSESLEIAEVEWNLSYVWNQSYVHPITFRKTLAPTSCMVVFYLTVGSSCPLKHFLLYWYIDYVMHLLIGKRPTHDRCLHPHRTIRWVNIRKT